MVCEREAPGRALFLVAKVDQEVRGGKTSYRDLRAAVAYRDELCRQERLTEPYTDTPVTEFAAMVRQHAGPDVVVILEAHGADENPYPVSGNPREPGGVWYPSNEPWAPIACRAVILGGCYAAKHLDAFACLFEPGTLVISCDSVAQPGAVKYVYRRVLPLLLDGCTDTETLKGAITPGRQMTWSVCTTP